MNYSEIEKYIIQISSEGPVGNGIVIGDLFITAGHVVEGKGKIRFKIEDDSYSFTEDDALVIKYDKVYPDDGMFDDCAVFRLAKKYNDLSLYTSVPEEGDKLLSISIKHGTKPNVDGIFTYEDREFLVIKTSEATVTRVIGNFIVCEMSEPLEPGRSGSPLFRDGSLVGILHGGNDGITCFWQSAESIARLMKQ